MMQALKIDEEIWQMFPEARLKFWWLKGLITNLKLMNIIRNY